jgi:cytochrome c5
MKTFKSPKGLLRLAFAGALMAGLVSVSSFADPPAGASPTNSAAASASAPGVVKKHLTGVELYSIHCNRCHAERYPTERTGANWKTIMLHMQVRANIPGQQARLILQYLQDNSGR